MKVLVIGKNGQVGRAVSELLAAKTNWVVESVGSSELNLENTGGIQDFILPREPQWIVNTAAYTAVDQAESDQSAAHQINALAPGEIAKAAEILDAKLIHFSTDYVFDGNSREPYTEADRTDPQSVYGETKLQGEQAVLEHSSNPYILRTAWVYSEHGKNFVKTMIRLAGQNPKLRVVEDQWGSPTYASALAEVVMSVVTHAMDSNQPGGVFHATGRGKTNWYQFCREIMKLLQWDHVEIEPITTTEFPTPAARPAYSVLDNSKLRQSFNIELPDWQDSLAECLSKINIEGV